MMRVGSLIFKYSKALLENKQHAVMVAAILSVLPFASWLSVALVSLVTLRKGAKPGFELLLPALVIHSVPLMMLVPTSSALINTLITYVPCYVAALGLRRTASWQVVCALFLAQIFCAFSFIQCFAPDFVIGQFAQFKKLLSHYPEYQQLIDTATGNINPVDLAQLFFGIQIVSVVASALISLVFARLIQAKLFMPGGLKAELMDFRSGRLAFLLFIGVCIGSYYEIACAINLFPLVFGYFLLSGCSLVYFILVRKWQAKVVLLLLLLVVLQPTLVLFASIILGSLDSLFNFRLYLPGRARESI